MVARSGLLALPARETIYWMAKTDASGAPLDGNCRYSLSGTALDARLPEGPLHHLELVRALAELAQLRVHPGIELPYPLPAFPRLAKALQGLEPAHAESRKRLVG